MKTYREILTEGKAQEIIMSALNGLENKSAEISLNDIARKPEAHGVHFKKFQSAAKALAKRGKIEYDGFSKVKLK
jgi:hypothetical protein